jgi:hypothetical protein
MIQDYAMKYYLSSNDAFHLFEIVVEFMDKSTVSSKVMFLNTFIDDVNFENRMLVGRIFAYHLNVKYKHDFMNAFLF